jgi:DNA primase
MIPRVGTNGKSSWQEVRGLCPVCRHHGWCRITPDGSFIACRRQMIGAIKRLDYQDGSQAWLHCRDDRRRPPSSPLPIARPQVSRADDAVLDLVYRALLASPELHLTNNHRNQLHKRGLAVEDLKRDLYRSLPPCSRYGIVQRLLDRFDAHELLTVPGIVARNGPHGRYVTVAGRAGLLIPVLTQAEAVVGLVVRCDDPGHGGKYRWLTSAFDGGPSPGVRVHVPAGVKVAPQAVVVEGTLKANVVQALLQQQSSGNAAVGLPGCNVNAETIATLRALGVKDALLAFDADVRSNPQVARAQAAGAQLLGASGFAVGLIRWDPALGKGYDDMLLALKETGR